MTHYIVAALLLLTTSLVEGVVIIQSPSEAGTGLNYTLWAPKLDRFGGYDWKFPNWTGEIVNITSARKQGNAVLLKTESGRSWDYLVRREVDAGAAAIVIVVKGRSMSPGGASYVLDGTDVSGLRIPVVDILQDNATYIEELLANQSVFISITCCDVNPWTVLNQSWFLIFWSVVVTTWAVVIFSISFYKLFYNSYYNGLQLNINTICLCVLIISSTIRAFYAAIDPFETRWILTSLQANVLGSITFPMTTLTMLLIALRWLEFVTEVVVKVHKVLHKLFWPFVVIACLVFAMELSTSICRGLDYDITGLVYATAILYIVIDIGVSSVFTVAGIKVIKQLRESAESTSYSAKVESSSQRLIRTTTLLIISVSCNLIFIGSLAVAATWVYLEPVGYLVTSFFIFVSLLSSDLFKAILLTTHRPEDRRAGSTAATKSNSGPTK